MPAKRISSRIALGSYFVAGAAVLFLPLILWQLNLPFIGNTYGEAYEPFELFAFCASLALIVGAAIELRKRRGAPFAELLPVLVPFLLLLHFLFLVSEYSFKAWDYTCYEAAAASLLQNENPYGQCYLYPPLLAEGMAGLHKGITWVAAVIGAGLTAEKIWNVVFYFFQTAQFILLGLAYALSYRLARNLGLKSTVALILVAVLLVANNPLLRTLRHNQVNLWVLDLTLLALLAADHAPLVSGVAVALGSHLKLYPAALLLPWTLGRRWRPVGAAMIGLLAIVFIEADWGRDWTLWQQYLAASAAFPRGTAFRDNSLHSVIHNFLGLAVAPAETGREQFQAMVGGVVILLSLAGAAWLVMRFLRRERVYMVGPQHDLAKAFRDYGQAMDALALALIVAPRVWEHHYVLAMPIVIWAVAAYGRARPWLIGLSGLLMLGLPTFDVFPLSYHRLAGLLLLLSITPPGAASPLEVPTPRPQSLL